MKKLIIERKKIIDYFIELIPDKHRKTITNEKQWMSVDLLSFLNLLQRKLIEILRDRYKSNIDDVEQGTIKSLDEYYPIRLKNLVYIEDLYRFEHELSLIIDKGTKNRMDIHEYVSNIPKSLLSKNQIDKFYEKTNILASFIELLPEEEKSEFPINVKWTGFNLIKKLMELIDELKQYRVKKESYFNDQDGSYIYKGHFLNISSLLSKIQKEDINEMKRVLIYVTHSVIFDKNYSINKYKYKEDAPDLVIISPNIIIKNYITVNLSCEHVPGYPEGKLKAGNGYGFCANGENGVAGLNGYNGGNLLIFSDKILFSSNLKFVSKGTLLFY